MDAQKSPSISARPFVAPETVMIRPLLLKPQWMNGLTEWLLVNNYGGALRRLNAIRAHLATLRAKASHGLPLQLRCITTVHLR